MIMRPLSKPFQTCECLYIVRTTILIVNQRLSTNYVGVASMTFLLYDHILTFNDEVDRSIIRSNSNHLDRCSMKVAYIWRRRKGFSEFVLLRSISIASEIFSVGSLFLIVSDNTLWLCNV